MSKFGCHFVGQVTATTPRTSIKIVPAAGKKLEIVELIMTGAGTVAPADIQHQATFAFLTNAVVGVAQGVVIPEEFDQAGAASTASVTTIFTSEPTAYGAVFPVAFGFNQRGGMRWGVPQGEGLKVDQAQTQLAAGWRVASSTAGAVDGDANWWEA